MTEIEQAHVLDECDEDCSNTAAADALRAVANAVDALCAIFDEKE